MKITTLIEDTCNNPNLTKEHGLSLFLSTCDHRILFDMGQSDQFIKNANSVGIDLSKSDLAIVSHGHYDHGGGLNSFLSVHKSAPVYIRKEAFEPLYAKGPSEKFVGLEPATLNSKSRLVFTEDYHKIDDGLILFSQVDKNNKMPQGNQLLYKLLDHTFHQDDFDHEQNLYVEEDYKKFLFTGCSHSGIVNIVEHFHHLFGSYPDYVIGGFHLFNPVTGQSEEDSFLQEIADFFNKTNAVFYTGHCTGAQAYSYLKNKLSDKIQYLSIGTTINL